MKRLCILLLLLAITSSWGQAPIDKNDFRQYWYAGKAELTRYALEQARYGEIHKGDAVLIFVTEPFLTDKQVKHEVGEGSKAVSVLKLNLVKKFFTGIYPYSIMTSIFTPVDVSRYRTLKVTSSSQEFCGHTFTQLNFRNNQYQTQVRSYFQEEGDRNFDLKAVPLEDEIWTRIRLAPESLPKGEIEMIPATQFARLWHVGLQPEPATATLNTKGSLNEYKVEYKKLPRKLSIFFEKQFPYQIVSWQENHPGGFGGGAWLTTKATKTNTLLLDYWNRHGNEDAVYREKLGLSMK